MVRTPPPFPLPPAAAAAGGGENANNDQRGGRDPPQRVEPAQNREQVPPPAVPARLVDLSVANLIEVFRGDGTGPIVKDFFRLFENAAAMGRWTREDMLRILQLKVKGAAATFLSSLLDLHGQDVEYDVVRRAIIDRFTGKQTQHFHYANLTNAIQMRNESVEAFADRIRRLGTLTITPRVNPDEQRVVQEEAEKRMLHAFLHGLSGPAGQATRHKFPETWDEAVQYAVMVAADERSHTQREQKAVFSTLATCYNCQRPGHLARECRAPKRVMGGGNGGNVRDTPFGAGTSSGRGESGKGRAENNAYGAQGARGSYNRFGQSSRGAVSRRPLTEVECYNCHGKGHYASSCPKPKTSQENRRGPVA